MDAKARERLLDQAMQAYWDAPGNTRDGVRAALSVIEPVVRADEREACAKVADAEAAKAADRVAIAKARGLGAEWPETRAQAAEEASIRIATAIRRSTTGGEG